MKKLKTIMPLILALTIIFSSRFSTKSDAARAIRLIVNGVDITELSEPRIEQDRTLVPIRFISEQLGATVTWDNENRTVKVDKDGDTFLLRIDSRLVEYNNGEAYEITDVAPKLVNERTFVPLRLVSNALNININWDEANRYVLVDSDKPTEVDSGFKVNIATQNDNETINGKTQLQMTSTPTFAKLEGSVKYLLLDRDTGKGFVIGRGEEVLGSYEYIPRLEDNGKKVLVGAIYDKAGNFVAGDAIGINVNIIPEVSLNGVSEGQVITGKTKMSPDVNFVASYIKYEFTNLNDGKVDLITEFQDQKVDYTWSPKFEDNGPFSIKAIAYDSEGKEYKSEPVNVKVSLEKSLEKLSLLGVKEGAVINNTVTLLADRNFEVKETEYLIKDVKTGVVTSLAKIPYGEYKWIPTQSSSGVKELWVKVIDSKGKVRESAPIKVTVDGSAKAFLAGIGPKQVVTGAVKLKTTSNVEIESVDYILTNNKTGARRVLVSNHKASEEYTYTPISGDAGDVTIQAEAIYGGKKLLTEKISFKVYLGTIHGPKAVIEKDKFIGMASELAKISQEKTGMSAALQTAQSILETGFGQSVPVDKYTGLLSNNLFGIKGNGPEGAVTSSTWEVYNGVKYTIDANFRAYDSVASSWADHKEFLKKERYDNLRAVMHDPLQGAWALKTAGYATDPEYPIKLMRLIKQYNLLELDKVGI